METGIDVLLHIVFSLLAGYIAWRIYFPNNKDYLRTSCTAALVTGVLIDADHLIDYFFAYGFHFNYYLFFYNNAFTKSGKMFVLFHGFEYAIFFAIAISFVKAKKIKMILAALAISMLFHLFVDISLFNIPPQYYFITYRILNGFKGYTR